MSDSVPLPFQTANVFAPTPHAGNQAAVVILAADDARANGDEFLRTIAADFNLSETAFVTALKAGPSAPRYSLRWFTPEVEVPMCGHGTLAAATALFTVHAEASELHFETRWRGTLVARREGAEGKATRIALSLPAPDVTLANPEKTATVLRVARVFAGLEEEDIVRVATWSTGTILEVKSSVDVGALKVDTAKLLPDIPELLVLTQAAGTKDTVARINSRCFHPSVGVPEDPVTGVAHTALTSYFLHTDGVGRTSVGAGTEELDARQLSKRGGAMRCALVDGRARLSGLGWRTMKGEMDAL